MNFQDARAFVSRGRIFPTRSNFLSHFFVAAADPCKAMLDTSAPGVAEEVGTLSTGRWEVASCRRDGLHIEGRCVF